MNDLVVKHLLANRLPGTVTWVGTRAWDKTKFMALDVDFRGEAHLALQPAPSLLPRV